jgi:hypothetical protein
MADNQIDWSNTLTSDPLYGAVPTLTVSNGGVGYQANTASNITVTSSGVLPGGYTIGGLNGASGSNTVWTTNTIGAGSYRINDPAAVLSASGKMALKGDGADIDINGKSLNAWMEKVEERLNILTPNPELEKEWDELRRLGERYRRLEKKCKEKAKVWEKLKAMPSPGIK